MTLMQMYQGFRDALVHGRMTELPEYVDPDAYTENCVGLTGWITGLDAALAEFRSGIAKGFSELSATQLDVVESDGMLVIRSRNAGTHTGEFMGIRRTDRRVMWDAVDMYRAGPDGRIAWRFLLCDWNGVRAQLLDPLSFGSETELRDWLTTNGVPVQDWGNGTKRVADLWPELVSGETVITRPPPERRVTFVSVIVKRGNRTLTEVAQLLASGETRKRNWPPGEKMLPGEDAETAALRCVEEELGVPSESCRIVRTHEPDSRTGDSLSYPGLVTRYRMNSVEMEIPDLPETAFNTPETVDPTIKIHYWDWC